VMSPLVSWLFFKARRLRPAPFWYRRERTRSAGA